MSQVYMTKIDDRKLFAFVQHARAVHGNLYNYSKVSKSGLTIHTPVTVICKKHGAFTTTRNIHCSRGLGCDTCSDITKSAQALLAKSIDNKERAQKFLKGFKNIHKGW